MISVQYWLDYLKEKSEKEQLTSFEKYHFKMMMLNFDCRKKEVGDKVFIWDTSLLVDFESNEYVTDSDILFAIPRYEGIIIEDDCVYEIVTSSMTDIDIMTRLFLDLVIYFPKTGRKFRTHSDFVRISTI